MGHIINYLSVNKRTEIMPAAEHFAAVNVDREENPSGSYHGNMHVHSTPVYNSWDDACNAIDLMDRGFYDDHAVQYRLDVKPSKKILNLKERKESLMEKRRAYIQEHSVQNHAAKFISCKECGSKLNKERLASQKCPVCGNDLRAEYVLNRICDFDKKINKIEKDIRAEQSKLNEKQTKTAWCVKVEVHS